MKLDSTIRRIAYSVLTMNGLRGESNTPPKRRQRAAKYLGISVQTLNKAINGESVKPKDQKAILENFMGKGRKESFPYYVHYVNHKKDGYKKLDALLEKTLNSDKQERVKQKTKRGKTKLIKYQPSRIRKDEMGKYFEKIKSADKRKHPSTRQLQYALGQMQSDLTPAELRKRKKKSSAKIVDQVYYEELDLEGFTPEEIEDALLDFFDNDNLYSSPTF